MKLILESGILWRNVIGRFENAVKIQGYSIQRWGFEHRFLGLRLFLWAELVPNEVTARVPAGTLRDPSSRVIG